MPLCNWYNYLSQEWKKCGYLVNRSKSRLLSSRTKLQIRQRGCLEMRSMLQLKVSATWGPSSDLKSSKINIVGKKSLEGKENSKHYLR